MIDRLLMQMRAMQRLSDAQEVTADNLANINTPGFKGNTLFYRMLKNRVDGQQVSQTVSMQEVNMEQGILEPTGNAFDFGIDGNGFFMMEENGREYLTRDGRFHIDSDGYLVNSQGAKVIGSAGPVHIPEYFMATGHEGGGMKAEVAKDGTLRINGEVQDKLQIVSPADPSLLERRGETYFEVLGNNQLSENTGSTVMQGYYEKSNINPLQEMVDMMSNTQMFEAHQRAIRTTDEMLSQVSNRLGKF